MADAKPRSLLKQLEIPPVLSQYILSLMNFIINNHKIFHTNSTVHNINTRNKYHLQRPKANLFCFQKSTFYVDIITLNSLLCSWAILKNEKAKFKATLRKYLHAYSFYFVNEQFKCKDNILHCFVKCL